MSSFSGDSLIVSLNSIVGNTETLGKTKLTGKQIHRLPREYWLSVRNLREKAHCMTVRQPV